MKKLLRLPVLALVPLLSLWPQLLRADPLEQWHLRYGPATPSSLNSVAFGNGMFVAVGDTGTILTSGEQVNWLLRKSGTTQPLRAITYANGLFVAVGGSTDQTTHSIIVTSPDGVSWTLRSAGTLQQLQSVTYGNATFVATGSNGTIVTSPDGIAWTRRSSQTSADLVGITYGEGAFLAVGSSGWACPKTRSTVAKLRT